MTCWFCKIYSIIWKWYTLIYIFVIYFQILSLFCWKIKSKGCTEVILQGGCDIIYLYALLFLFEFYLGDFLNCWQKIELKREPLYPVKFGRVVLFSYAAIMLICIIFCVSLRLRFWEEAGNIPFILIIRHYTMFCKTTTKHYWMLEIHKCLSERQRILVYSKVFFN